MKFILKLIAVALVIFFMNRIIPGITVTDIYAALWASLVFAALNLLLKPLISLFTMPITILTLGLFGLVVNGLLLYMVPAFVSGIAISGFLAAFLGALVISAVNWLISHI